jgi:hypothetical protein
MHVTRYGIFYTAATRYNLIPYIYLGTSLYYVSFVHKCVFIQCIFIIYKNFSTPTAVALRSVSASARFFDIHAMCVTEYIGSKRYKYTRR